MDKKELVYWLGKYNTEEDLYNKNEENVLGQKFRTNSFIEKEDLINIMKWKFQGRLQGRQKRFLGFIDKIESSFIQDVSELAFKSKNDESKLKLLSCIDGVGLSVSSVILAFYDPTNYGIVDIHSWRGIFKEKEPSDIFTNTKQIVRFFGQLRLLSKEHNMACRDIEKAFFKKNKDEK